ncbi:MAG: MASE1 domain-containing protein, partial [Betaproteobacteria bacterium]|nr:MASE1 domain-containing protein [Betaproteobacteria bacterium]
MRALLISSGYIAAYVLLDWVSDIYPLGPFALTPWNPPPGLSIALLLVHGLRFTPALLVAGFAAEFIVRGAPQSLAYAAIATASVTLCYAATAAILRRLDVDPELKSLRDVSRFVMAALAAPILAALGYIGTYGLAGRIAWVDAPHSALQFWVGDAIGILVTTPVVIQLYRALRRPAERGHAAEMIAQAAAVTAALALVFGIGGQDAPKFFYVLFLPLIWISVRHGTRGAIFALLAIQIGIIAAVRIAGFSSATVLEFQLLMSAMAVTGLILGAVVSDRKRA